MLCPLQSQLSLLKTPNPHQDPFAFDAERAATLSDKEYYDAKYAIPCSITGAMAAASGGALGFVFGFGSRVVRGASPLARGGAAAGASAPATTRLAAALAAGRASAASFAAFGGVYSAAACAVSRARDVEADPLNSAIAGCITGAALGWRSGPAGMAQSCAMLGGFSYFIDRMQGGQVAQAAELVSGGGGGGGGGGGEEEGGLALARRRQRRRQRQQGNGKKSSSSLSDSPDSITCSSLSSPSSSSSSGTRCCAVGGPLGAAFASSLSSSYSSSAAAAAAAGGNRDSSGDDLLTLLMGPQLREAAEGAARKLGSAVRGAAVESVRSSKARRWKW